MEGELSCLPSFFSSWICLLRSTIWTPGKKQAIWRFLFIFLTPFTAFYDYSWNARRVVWKLASETHPPEDWVLREKPIWRQIRLCDMFVVKLDPKWHYLDLRNSDLISIGSLTHSLTLGFIYGLNIHGCGKEEVVKINLWGKLIWLA